MTIVWFAIIMNAEKCKLKAKRDPLYRDRENSMTAIIIHLLLPVVLKGLGGLWECHLSVSCLIVGVFGGQGNYSRSYRRQAYRQADRQVGRQASS